MNDKRNIPKNTCSDCGEAFTPYVDGASNLLCSLCYEIADFPIVNRKYIQEKIDEIEREYMQNVEIAIKIILRRKELEQELEHAIVEKYKIEEYWRKKCAEIEKKRGGGR